VKEQQQVMEEFKAPGEVSRPKETYFVSPVCSDIIFCLFVSIYREDLCKAC
jgi:hypothetical protein